MAAGVKPVEASVVLPGVCCDLIQRFQFLERHYSAQYGGWHCRCLHGGVQTEMMMSIRIKMVIVIVIKIMIVTLTQCPLFAAHVL